MEKAEMTTPTREEVWVSDTELDALLKGKGHMKTLEMDLARDLHKIRSAYQSQAQELEASKKLARDMEECVDNIREAMGLGSTHFLVLHDDVREMRLERDQLKAENQVLLGKGKQLCCRVGVLEIENQALRDKLAQQTQARQRIIQNFIGATHD